MKIKLLMLLLSLSTFLLAQTNDSIPTLKIEQDSSSVIFEEDGDLLISDENEELLIENKTPEKKIETTTKTEVNSSTSNEKKSVTIPVEKKETETISVFSVKKKKTTVKKEEAIDFGANVKNYRSPKKAMLLSFLVPGLGQAYAKKKIKGAIYGAVEIALIAGVISQVVKGKKYRDDALKIAETHYDFNRFKDYYSKTVQPHLVSKNDTTAVSMMAKLFNMHDTISFDNILTQLAQGYNDDKTYHYTDDEYNMYVAGWSDASLTDIGTVTEYLYSGNINTPRVNFGVSALQTDYLKNVKTSKPF